jgi:hypothetical protein
VRSDLLRLFEVAAFGKVAPRIRQATTASIHPPLLFPSGQLLSGKGQLLWPKAKPPARKASFLSSNALTAEDEGQALALNGQVLRLKASFLPDYPPILIATGLALWSGSPGGGFLHEQRAWVPGCWPVRLPPPLALA